ncbi:3-dehydroquinate synthase, partial [Bacillus sp. S34]|nr:3-dehydroquinate synthase [Bacillus sp. S34]
MTESTPSILPEGTTEIRVGGDDGYVVAVGNGLLGSVPALLGPRVAKVLIVHAPTLGARANDLRQL